MVMLKAKKVNKVFLSLPPAPAPSHVLRNQLLLAERNWVQESSHASPKNKMAEQNGGSAVPSGYDYDFVSLIDDDFICQICQLPLKKAVLTRCGHRFCGECLGEYLRR